MSLLNVLLIGENSNWTEVLGTVAATINSQHGRGKHDVSAFEAVYGQKYHHPLLCSKEEARKCWTLPKYLRVTNDEAFATYIAQHFYVRDKKYTSNSNAVTTGFHPVWSKIYQKKFSLVLILQVCRMLLIPT